MVVAAVGNTLRLKPASFAELGNNMKFFEIYISKCMYLINKMILFAAQVLFSSINQIVYVKSDNDVSEKLINMMEKFTKRMIDLEYRLDAMNK